jgi:hypothetical protein
MGAASEETAAEIATRLAGAAMDKIARRMNRVALPKLTDLWIDRPSKQLKALLLQGHQAQLHELSYPLTITGRTQTDMPGMY